MACTVASRLSTTAGAKLLTRFTARKESQKEKGGRKQRWKREGEGKGENRRGKEGKKRETRRGRIWGQDIKGQSPEACFF